MASTKRSRPVFSPPRPKKATKPSTSKATPKSAGPSKTKAQKVTLGSTRVGKQGSSSKSKAKPVEKASRRSKLVSPTPSASDSLAEDDEEDDVSDDDNDENDETLNPTNRDAEDSPEPDYILAEVTHESSSSEEPPIPVGLIHRILHSQFSEPDKTKISTDARDMVAKYIEIFVREAVMRCAYEKSAEEREGGWLDLEDLEKVAVQLCLDF